MPKALIIQLNRMGDCAQTLPVVKALKTDRPEYHLTVLCVQEFKQVFLNTPFVDRFVFLSAATVEKIAVTGEMEGFDAIGEFSEPYDLVINLTHNRIGGYLCEKISALDKAGMAWTGRQEIGVGNEWAKYAFASQAERRHNLFNIVDMHVGMTGAAHRPVAEYMTPLQGDLDEARGLLAANGYKGSGRLIAFQLGAGKLYRSWPVSRFISLAHFLSAQSPEVEIVLLGSGAETHLAREFMSGNHFSAIDLVGKTGMRHLAPILKLCDLLVGNDTGTVHIAAAVGTRVIGIYLATASFTETAPYGEGHVIFQTDLPCAPCHETNMCGSAPCREAIDPAVVAQVIGSFLNRGPLPEISSTGFSVYQSRFLSNGSLIYTPLQITSASDWYITALIYRLMWESVFGMNHDASIIEYFDNSLLRSSFYRKSNEIKWGIDELISKYNHAIEAITEYVKMPSQTSTINANKCINEVERSISAGGPSILGHYHMLHMAAMSFSNEDFYVLHKINSIYRRIHHSMTVMGNCLDKLTNGACRPHA